MDWIKILFTSLLFAIFKRWMKIIRIASILIFRKLFFRLLEERRIQLASVKRNL